MQCPKCETDAPAGAPECPGCGVIFAKLPGVRGSVPRIQGIEEERIGDGTIGPGEWKVMGFGLVAALLAYALPLTRFLFSTVVTLFHEFGHAVAGWLFGYASLPAFDLVYGGGLTHHGPFRLSIAIAVGCVFAWLGWIFRENKTSLVLIGVIFAIWLVFVTREWRREIVFAAAGHVAECILAGIFFYKALAGVGWRAPSFERPLGAFVAFFVQIHSTLFAWRLIRDAEFLAWYRQGKGGALMSDLEVIALNLQIWLGYSPQIEGVAKALLVFSMVPTVVALIWYFERARWHRVLRALRTVDA